VKLVTAGTYNPGDGRWVKGFILWISLQFQAGIFPFIKYVPNVRFSKNHPFGKRKKRINRGFWEIRRDIGVLHVYSAVKITGKQTFTPGRQW